MGLSERQKRILDCITHWVEEYGYPPSVREIARETGIQSTRGVTMNLDALEDAGYLRRDSTARSISLTSSPLSPGTRLLPVVGTIAAGTPLLAEENVEGQVPVPEPFAPEDEDCFVLKVRGDSMQDAGIHDGDLIIVRHQPVAENGELAAVMLEGEATVKRFFREGPEHVRLEPANAAYQPITVSLKESRTMVIGKVVGLLRNYR